MEVDVKDLLATIGALYVRNAALTEQNAALAKRLTILENERKEQQEKRAD